MWLKAFLKENSLGHSDFLRSSLEAWFSTTSRLGFPIPNAWNYVMDNLCHISQRIKQKSQDIVVQLLSSVIDSLWPMNCSTPGFPVLHCLPHLLKLMSIESAMPSNHLILCHPLLLCPQSFPASVSFSMGQFLKITSGGQSIGVSASASVLQWIFRTDFL